MKILVTGSSGLIGRWVVRQLRVDGHTVAGLDILGLTGEFGSPDIFFNCNILDRNAVLEIFHEFNPDAVLHLAARTDLNEKCDLNQYASNIDGVANILQAVRDTPSVVRVIYTSSQLVCKVGYTPSSYLDYCPTTVYGMSKVRTEEIVRAADGGGKNWCLVRPTTVWGPYMSDHYQKLLLLIKKGLFFHTGRSKLYKSYAYAGNIAFQYSQLLRVPSDIINGRTFYLCDYEPLSLRDYADALAQGLKAPKIPTLPLFLSRILAKIGDGLNFVGLHAFPFNSFRLGNILTEYTFDVSETRKVCGPLPYDFRRGIKDTIKWYESQQL